MIIIVVVGSLHLRAKYKKEHVIFAQMVRNVAAPRCTITNIQHSLSGISIA
jgi:hypothetical protein